MDHDLRVLWAGGAMLQLGFLGWQLLRLRRIQRTGIPWLEGRDLARMLAAECGVRGRSMSCSTRRSRPQSLAAPYVPSYCYLSMFGRWSEDDLRRALIHELEHVRRGDWAMQRIARVTVACYWFHPLVWVAWRRFCLEAERAADDAVLRTAQSAEYAEQLVGLARSMSNAEAHPVPGMANRSDLSARVSAMLDSNQRRGRAGFLAAAGAIAAAALVLAMIGPLTAVAQSPGPRSVEAEPGSRPRSDKACTKPRKPAICGTSTNSSRAARM